jgi:hypothetical protein
MGGKERPVAVGRRAYILMRIEVAGSHLAREP